MGNICLGAGLNKSRFLSGIADSVPSQLWKSQDKPPSEDPTLPPPTIQIPSYHHPSSKNSDPTSTSQSGTNQSINQKPTSESQNYLQPSSENKKSTSETNFSQGPTGESTSYEEPRVYQESRNSQKPSSESRNPQEPTLEFRFSEEPLKELKDHQESKSASRKTEKSESTNSHGLESDPRHYQESTSEIGISSESSRNYQESTSEPDIYHEPSTELEESEGDQNQEEEEEMNRFGAEAGGSHSARVLNEKTANVRDLYTLGRRLGQGQFGTTYLCIEKGTDNVFACKSIAKRKLLSKDDVEDVRREIQIMHHLAGHPNVVMIKGAYEDVASVHLVMELCAGGELFDRIIERGHYTERKAAELTRTIVGVVEACHSLGVMHRDLKPENFLLSSTSEDSPLKATDFGLSIFFKPGENFSDVVGSPYYVAPEVLQKNYGIEADIWSAGVILYILLSGVPPFWAETEHGIFEQVLHGELDFQSDPWPIISDSAKDLISKMLDRDPKKRPTAHEVLCHPWIKEDGIAPDRPLDSAVLSRLKQFSAMNKIKKMALRVIAESLSEDEIAGLKEMFKMMDTDNSGSITFDELKDGLNRVGANLMESEIRALMEAADIDNSGTIDYGEFIAATLHLNKMEREENLHSAFAYFDKDGSGYITIDELQQACQDFGIDDGRLEEMIQEVDQDNDGRIDFDEFVAMMRKESGGIGRKTMQNNLDLRDALKIV